MSDTMSEPNHPTMSAGAELPKKLELWFHGDAKGPVGEQVACYAWSLMELSVQIESRRGCCTKRGSKNATANYAAYFGLGKGLAWLGVAGWMGELTLHGDNRFVINQVGRKWTCDSERLLPLLGRCFELLNVTAGSNYRSVWVPGEKNSHCSLLSSAAYREFCAVERQEK